MRGFQLVVIGGALFVAQTASAQQQQQGTPYATQPVYTAPPPPNGGQPTGGEYVAPQQQQQPVYVQQNVGLMGPREITSWEDGDPVPPGYHPDTRARKGLIIGGAVMFGTMYLISALVAMGSMAACSTANTVDFITGQVKSCTDMGFLFVPVAGPFIEIAHSSSNGAGTAALVFDGVLQAGGVAMIVLGIAIPRTVLVRNDLALGKKKTLATIEPVIGMQSGLKITF